MSSKTATAARRQSRVIRDPSAIRTSLIDRRGYRAETSFPDLYARLEHEQRLRDEAREAAYDALDVAFRSSGVLTSTKREMRHGMTAALVLTDAKGRRGIIRLSYRGEHKPGTLVVEDVLEAGSRARTKGANLVDLLGDSIVWVTDGKARTYVRSTAREFWHAAVKAAGTTAGVTFFALAGAAACLFLASLGLPIPADLIHQANEIIRLVTP